MYFIVLHHDQIVLAPTSQLFPKIHRKNLNELKHPSNEARFLTQPKYKPTHSLAKWKYAPAHFPKTIVFDLMIDAI